MAAARSSPRRDATWRSTSGIDRVSWSGRENTGPDSDAIGIPTPGEGTSSSNRSKVVDSGSTRSAQRAVSSMNDPKAAMNGMSASSSATPADGGTLNIGFVPATSSARTPAEASASASTRRSDAASVATTAASPGSASAGHSANGGG